MRGPVRRMSVHFYRNSWRINWTKPLGSVAGADHGTLC
jgi:hypothetical protein